jgi:hypothetical protein
MAGGIAGTSLAIVFTPTSGPNVAERGATFPTPAKFDFSQFFRTGQENYAKIGGAALNSEASAVEEVC